MLIRPRPSPPNPLLYSVNEYAKLQMNYLADVDEWQREANFAMWTSAAPVVCAAIAVIALAIMGPGIALDMIRILAAAP